MFPDGERKPGTIRAPELPAADEDMATAAITMATAVEMRSESFMDAPLIDDAPHPGRAPQQPRHGRVTVRQRLEGGGTKPPPRPPLEALSLAGAFRRSPLTGSQLKRHSRTLAHVTSPLVCPHYLGGGMRHPDNAEAQEW